MQFLHDAIFTKLATFVNFFEYLRKGRKKAKIANAVQKPLQILLMEILKREK